MRDDVLELLRDRNPVPVDPPPPPIDSVLSRLDEAAAEGEPGGIRPRRGEIGGWIVVVAGAALALVILVLAGTGRRSTTRTGTPGSAAGLVAPVLRPGQAWHYVTVEQSTSPFHPPGARVGIGPYPDTLTSSSRAAVVSRFRIDNWIPMSGAQHTRGRDAGKPRFIGSAGERASWVREHSVGDAVAGASFSSPGFAVGPKTFTYAEVLRFPTDPGAVIRLLGLAKATAAERLDQVSSLLQSVPLLPPARAAVFQALVDTPGIRDLGAVDDPLGSSGIALAASGAPFPATVSGPLARLVRRAGSLPTRVELVFDPGTMALLASETVLVKPSHIRGISAGYPVLWTAFEASGTVSAASVPPAQVLGARPPSAARIPLRVPPARVRNGTPFAPGATSPLPRSRP
ncbi:MAG TPA: hypothetical protein VG186_16895 [Solirubrobacteraceae bacterium]|jgi:hypothetical protein|nr:hypothetical protein [Solirubrobacteraceae bacterium]